MHYGKAEKEKAEPWLEIAEDFCEQAMQEPCYWFGFSWTLGQTLIETLPNLSRRILEAWNVTFHSLLLWYLGIFTAKHCILIQTQNTRSYLWQNWIWTCVSRVDSTKFLYATGPSMAIYLKFKIWMQEQELQLILTTINHIYKSKVYLLIHKLDWISLPYCYFLHKYTNF